MDFDKRLVIGMLGLSMAAATSVSFPTPSLAQNIRQRLRDRIEGNQSNSGQQQQQQQQNLSLPGGQQAPSSGPDVSMVTLQTRPGEGGQQLVITPKGMAVPLPGAGVNGSVVHIYIGSSGGYWYVDKNNQQVDLTPAVQMFQAQAAQAQPVSAIPQYAPQPQNYGAPVNTAAAAGLGAMAGSAMASNWGTVPYGTPVRYGAAAAPYYNQGGKPVYINASNNTVNDVNAYHATTMQQQQNWYTQQQVQQGANWKAWQQPTANPFVNSAYSQAAYGQAAAHYGATEGQQYAKYGAEAGQAAAHYGANQGMQDAKYGAEAGQAAAHYGAAQGQQDAKYGAEAGHAAAHYGAAQGQQDAKYGAEAGHAAAHHGAAEGQQSEQNGQEAGRAAAHRGASEGKQSEQNGQEAGRAARHRGASEGKQSEQNGQEAGRAAGRRGRGGENSGSRDDESRGGRRR